MICEATPTIRSTLPSALTGRQFWPLGRNLWFGCSHCHGSPGILLALGIALRRAKKERQAVSLWRKCRGFEERELAQEQLRQSS